jgi:methylmalonyl-CoA mutase
MAEKLFTEFQPVSTDQWEEVIKKDLKGADYDKKLIWKTLEGFAVRPYYRAEDLEKLSHMGSSPESFPFVRGTKKENNWLVRQGYCAWESYEKANRQALNAISRGVQSVAFCIDGKKEISQEEMSQLLDGIDLNKTEVNFEGCSCAVTSWITSFIAVASQKGSDLRTINASFDFDPLRTLTTTGNFCCENYKDTLAECIRLTKEYPGIRVIGVEAYAFSDAGSNLVQELAFGMSAGSEYINLLTEAGFTVDEIAPRIKFTFAVSSNYFMEIAKFRAARMLWANIVKAYGSGNIDSQKISIHAVTSQWNMTVYDSYVNMLRGTTEAMSASLGGVDSLEVLPFDYSYREPSEFSNRIARNTQIILKEEAYFDKINDPAAGSYYIENLTASIAEEAWKLFRSTEEVGGYIKALKEGIIQSGIRQTSSKRDMNIATRREILTGTNQYPNYSEKADKSVTKEIVTRGAGTLKSENAIVEPIEKYRGAQAFEELRFKTEQSGKNPEVFMITFGNLAFCRARAQFSGNFFAVAGFSVTDNNRFSSAEEGAKAALKSGADIVVACSSDEEYAEALPKIKDIIGDKAIIVVAGDPACKEDLMEKGITNFISVKSNVLDTLKDYQKKLGI